MYMIVCLHVQRSCVEQDSLGGHFWLHLCIDVGYIVWTSAPTMAFKHRSLSLFLINIVMKLTNKQASHCLLLSSVKFVRILMHVPWGAGCPTLWRTALDHGGKHAHSGGSQLVKPYLESYDSPCCSLFLHFKYTPKIWELDKRYWEQSLPEGQAPSNNNKKYQTRLSNCRAVWGEVTEKQDWKE